ncbi:MAG: ferritin-like domain-containing protein, partial [Polyangiaceae bacterium]
CFFSLDDCPALCPGAYFFKCRSYGNWCVDGSILPRDASVTLDDGSVVAVDPPIVECATCPNGAGRRPRGLRATRARSTVNSSALGSYFASTAHLEKASVVAFRTLRADLARLRAPKSLVRAAARAARDEFRHARETARLARRFGASPPKVVVAKNEERRSLESLALENAVEGCVRETFGALVASWQAAHAADADIAKSMTIIAIDETRHAAHAWSIAKWSAKRLDFASNKRAAVAMQHAITELEEASSREPHTDLVRIAGVPDVRTQRAMLAALRLTLWA